MGNCLDTCLPKQGDPRTRPYVQLQQQNTWSKTGIAGLRDQGLKELPQALADIASTLRVLDASNNRLQQLPSFVATLTALQRLVLAGNQLTIAPPPEACANLSSLKVLVLDDNLLSELPAEVGRLGRLERLSLRNNRLRSLPDSLGALGALQSLAVSANQLASLPEQLGECGRLEELDAQGNELESIPASLERLKRLKTLQLDNNRIHAVPSQVLYGCTALQTLSLHGCPIKPDDLQETPGFKEFDERRKSKYNKAIAGGALLGSRGLDEGVDRQVAQQSPGRRG
ncbi:hypothetical protein Agub_g8519 [Astrephomene gubernaculifera]|uniref:Disease resistance R13L4/SHOC-2-like LRR domain-containing protein n=1 Tax=Astrephomene gubernaculifera TaxID=47775 RepID=A0AAD3HN83_9CHLO|nr:hypothetical protein Agub_g8519 [Astrephomene gubernaculifera]